MHSLFLPHVYLCKGVGSLGTELQHGCYELNLGPLEGHLNIYFYSHTYVCVCVHAHTPACAPACEVQKGALNSLELELEIVVSDLMWVLRLNKGPL